MGETRPKDRGWLVQRMRATVSETAERLAKRGYLHPGVRNKFKDLDRKSVV